MVDLADRTEREAQLARKLGRAMGEARRRLLAAVEDGVVTDDEWRGIAEVFTQAIQADVENAVLAAGLAASEAMAVPMDSAALHAQAIAYARDYTFELVSKLDQTNRQLLQQTITDYFGQKLTLKDVETRLSQAFGPARAEAIAITEVTRAASQGEVEFNRELQRMGLQPVLVWATSADDVVCPICGPLNGKAQGDGWQYPPPAHPRCRCNVNTELREATR